MLVSGWREEAQVPGTADMFGSQQKHLLGEGPHSNFDWKWKRYSLGLFHAAYSHLVNYEFSVISQSSGSVYPKTEPEPEMELSAG